MKLNKRKQGISLIVLVITIIVMIILAAAIILALNSNNITGKANEAKWKNDISAIQEKAEMVKYDMLLVAQKNTHLLTQTNLVQLLHEQFEGSQIEGNVVVVDNKYDLVVDNKLNITIAETATNELLYGDGQIFNSFTPSTLRFKSSAELDDFVEVQVNGEKVDESNYTLKEGSTIVILNVDYLKNLDKATHEITVVSNKISKSAKFDVVEPEKNSHGFYYNYPYVGYVDYFGAYLAVFVRTDNTLDIIAGGALEECTYLYDGTKMTVTSPSIGSLNCTLSEDGKEMYNEELGATFRVENEAIIADEEYIYEYVEERGGYEVEQVINRNKSAYEPVRSEINGKPVTSIWEASYTNCVNLINAPEFPESVTILGSFAFSGCSKLSSITIPDTITSDIGACTFRNCSNLTNITIGKNISRIADTAFENCTSLTDITFTGTKEEWNQLRKGEGWNNDIPATQVVCSNGTVSLK